MKNDTEVLSLQELAKMQNELEEQAGKLVAEVSKRAATEKVPPEEIWTHLPLYRQKLYSTDNPEPKVATPVKGIVADVMDRLKNRRP